MFQKNPSKGIEQLQWMGSNTISNNTINVRHRRCNQWLQLYTYIIANEECMDHVCVCDSVQTFTRMSYNSQQQLVHFSFTKVNHMNKKKTMGDGEKKMKSLTVLLMCALCIFTILGCKTLPWNAIPIGAYTYYLRIHVMCM